jgi:hypothetical protein
VAGGRWTHGFACRKTAALEGNHWRIMTARRLRDHRLDCQQPAPDTVDEPLMREHRGHRDEVEPISLSQNFDL